MTSALDQMNTRLLVAKVKDSVSALVQDLVFEPFTEKSKEDLKTAVSGYLKDVQDKKGIGGYSVGPMTETYHGWKELYPNLKTRCLAMLARLLGLQGGPRPKWYHLAFPFVVENTPYIRRGYYLGELTPEDTGDHEDYYVDQGVFPEEVTQDNFDDAVDVRYYARLRVPYTSQDIPISIQPAVPVKYIQMTVAIAREGATMESL